MAQWIMERRLLPLLLLLSCSTWQRAASQQLCQPQGLLRLDQPYSVPHLQTLPFCSQYKCSCCRPSHALAIKRALLKGVDADSISPPCMEALEMLACRVCDPEVGLGAKPAVCASTCDDTFEACKQDFFGWHESSGLVVPCGGRDAQLLVCSKLLEVANSGAEFCAAAGYTESSEQPCFDGSYVGSDLCPEREPPVRPKRQRKPRSKMRSIQAQLDRIDLRALAAVVVLSGMVAVASFRMYLQVVRENAALTPEVMTAEQRREQLLRAVGQRTGNDSPRSSPRSSSGGGVGTAGSHDGVSLIGSGTGARKGDAKKRR